MSCSLVYANHRGRLFQLVPIKQQEDQCDRIMGWMSVDKL